MSLVVASSRLWVIAKRPHLDGVLPRDEVRAVDAHAGRAQARGQRLGQVRGRHQVLPPVDEPHRRLGCARHAARTTTHFRTTTPRWDGASHGAH